MAGTWEYRMVQINKDWLSIHEIYYDDEGVINGWIEEASSPGGETTDELKSDLTLMMTALYKPVLLKEDLPK
jgi:hypothetical protein